MKDRDKIELGECVSPYTVDRCPYCVDTCEAYQRHKAVHELKVIAEQGKDSDGNSFKVRE